MAGSEQLDADVLLNELPIMLIAVELLFELIEVGKLL